MNVLQQVGIFEIDFDHFVYIHARTLDRAVCLERQITLHSINMADQTTSNIGSRSKIMGLKFMQRAQAKKAMAEAEKVKEEVGLL